MLVKVMAKFYIITPVMNSLSWLKRCVYSVADQVQEGVEVYHFVQDGASTDGTVEWLQQWQQEVSNRPGYKFGFESVSDAGMYDALNKAWEKLPSDADITAHLNSDEQYMPGVLAKIAKEFELHPTADLLLGAHFVVDAQSRYICHRRPVRPWRWTSQAACEIITCTCFHKAESFAAHGVRFSRPPHRQNPKPSQQGRSYPHYRSAYRQSPGRPRRRSALYQSHSSVPGSRK